MATYNKKLKTLVVYQMLDGVTVTIEDTSTDDMATRALNEFKRYETMHYEQDGFIHAIPYHAVQYIEVTETDASITKANPYGCDGGDIVTLTLTECREPYAGMKIKVAKGSTIGDSAELAEISTNICQAGFMEWQDSSGNSLLSDYVLNEDMDIRPLCK